MKDNAVKFVDNACEKSIIKRYEEPLIQVSIAYNALEIEKKELVDKAVKYFKPVLTKVSEGSDVPCNSFLVDDFKKFLDGEC